MSKVAYSSLTSNRMIALSTHSRLCSELGFDKPHKLPLACPSHHPVSKEVKQRVRGLSWPSYEPRSEAAMQRLNSMHEGVVRAGQILQRKNLENPLTFLSRNRNRSLSSMQGQMTNQTGTVLRASRKIREA
jgi:hypothetical protein